MMPKNFIYGYKVFDHRMQSDGKRFQVDREYIKDPTELKGFTFCTDFSHIFDFSPQDPKITKVAEIIAYGDYFLPSDINRYWKHTAEIKIIREYTYAEIFQIENLFKIFSGYVQETTLDDFQITYEKLQSLLETIAHLSLKDKTILSMRFGILTGRPETLDGIGKELGITRERVRQLLQRNICSLLKGFNLKILPDTNYPDLQRIHVKCQEEV